MLASHVWLGATLPATHISSYICMAVRPYILAGNHKKSHFNILIINLINLKKNIISLLNIPFRGISIILDIFFSI